MREMGMNDELEREGVNGSEGYGIEREGVKGFRGGVG